jgi:hypothetical protein
VCGTEPTFESNLLSLQFLLRGFCDGHVTCVDAESALVCGGREVVVRGARVPEEKVAGFGADFCPCATFLLQPLHALVGETVPLGVPCRNVLALFRLPMVVC